MILITGSTGFIGSAMVKYLEANSFKIRSGSRTKKNNKYWKLDISNKDEVEKSCENIDSIIHLAALDFAQSEKNFEEAKRINFLSSQNLYNSAVNNGVKNFIYFSTCHVYGENLRNNVTEQIIPKPISNYAKTHYMTENYLNNCLLQKKMNISILRLSNIVGCPYTNEMKRWKYVANELCIQAIKNKEIILNTKGNQKRDFFSVENLLITIKNLLHLKEKQLLNGTYNIGSGKSISVLRLAELISLECKSIFGFNVDVIIGNEPVKNEDYNYDISKIKKTNIYNKSNSINESIKKMLIYCKENF